MATPRLRIVDPEVTPWYHCISRCVRRAFLCGEGFAHRKQWIEDRLQELVGLFAMDCAGFAVMDNHLHLLLRLDPQRGAGWTALEVAERWLRLFPLRGLDGNALPVSDPRLKELAAEAATVATLRTRLADLIWFMKCLKEPLARRANAEDQCTGAFWAARFRSVAILDEASLLATAAYIDLNPVAAGIAPTPEQSEHTSFRARLVHCRNGWLLDTLPDDLSTRTHEPAQETGNWLLPVEDCRPAAGARPGLMPGLTLSCYCRLIDWTSRVVRDGKAHVPEALDSIFARLQAGPDSWGLTVSRLFALPKTAGNHFGSPARLGDAAQKHGQRWVRNQFPRTESARAQSSSAA